MSPSRMRIARACASDWPSNEQEQWEEMTTIVRPASYWRTDVEVSRSRETRNMSGAMVGSPSTSAQVKFTLER